MTIVYTFICINLLVLVFIAVAIHAALEQSDNSSPQTWIPKNPQDYAPLEDHSDFDVPNRYSEAYVYYLLRKLHKSHIAT